MVIAEDVYRLFHRYCTYRSKGIWPKPIKNFDKQKATPDWIYFQRCADRVNSNKHIDLDFLIQALSQNFKGWFNPRYLVSMKGIKIYRVYVDKMTRVHDISAIEDLVSLNLKNVIEYCKENNLKSIIEYFNEDALMCPTFTMHLYSGKISKYFLALFNKNMFIGLNTDVADIYLTDFLNSYTDTRNQIFKSAKLRKISDNVEKIFKKGLDLIVTKNN
jgi:hypothetical protein